VPAATDWAFVATKLQPVIQVVDSRFTRLLAIEAPLLAASHQLVNQTRAASLGEGQQRGSRAVSCNGTKEYYSLPVLAVTFFILVLKMEHGLPAHSCSCLLA
jgi:hypothetical protein